MKKKYFVIFLIIELIVNCIIDLKSVNITSSNIKSYIVDLDEFNINNNGCNPVENSKGINKALKYAEEKEYDRIIFPNGVYCISENEPIYMVSNLTVDLNGSIFKINENGLQHYTVIEFSNCTDSQLVNGVILGDKETHDYKSIEGSHEWGCGIVFNDCSNCTVSNLTISCFPGYGIASSLGKNLSNLVTGVVKENLTVGNIGNMGDLNNQIGSIRTITPLDISNVGEEFELGYNKGYMGYPYMKNKEFSSYFYDEKMKFISKQEDCIQYKKIVIPKKSKYVHFVFKQDYIPESGDTDYNETTVFLTNYSSPNNIRIKNCIIEKNRTLGLAICGGYNWVIENNLFKENGGGSPGYAIDLEDGWEYMNSFLFENNKFINNSNDLVSCAGDEIVFKKNDFTSSVYIWGRTTNYKFLENTFTDISMNINYEYSTNTECRDNKYKNCALVITNKSKNAEFNIYNEDMLNTSINAMPSTVKLLNSTIKIKDMNNIKLCGNFKECVIDKFEGALVNVNLEKCTITNSNFYIQEEGYFKMCSINNSNIKSTVNSNIIKLKDNYITDTKLIISTWGAPTEALIENNDIKIDTDSFIDISAGVSKNIVLNGNDIQNNSGKSLINMYDTTYTKANGKLVLINNIINQKGSKYIFDGVNITDGKFLLIDKDNSINDISMINPQYSSSNFFYISN